VPPKSPKPSVTPRQAAPSKAAGTSSTSGTSGTSGAPQARKLGLKPGLRTALDAPPEDWALAGPPDGLLPSDADGAADVIVAFFRAAGEITDRLPALADRVFPAGAVWALWPRRAAGHVSDITDNVVRSCALDLGLVDVKVAAVDEDWSGLRLVWRTSNRLARRSHMPRRSPRPPGSPSTDSPPCSPQIPSVSP
jgi:hypothetical protein